MSARSTGRRAALATLLLPVLASSGLTLPAPATPARLAPALSALDPEGLDEDLIWWCEETIAARAVLNAPGGHEYGAESEEFLRLTQSAEQAADRPAKTLAGVLALARVARESGRTCNGEVDWDDTGPFAGMVVEDLLRLCGLGEDTDAPPSGGECV